MPASETKPAPTSVIAEAAAIEVPEGVEVSIDEVKVLAARFAVDLEKARDHLESVMDQANVLYRLLSNGYLLDKDGKLMMVNLPRLQFEAGQLAMNLANDLGVKTEEKFPGEFDLDRIADEARDLIALIDLASTAREPVGAASA